MYISKRILIIVGVSAVILTGIIASVFAYILSQSNSSTATATAITPTPSITATPKPGVRACALGVIQSISNQSFVVAETGGQQTVTVTVNARTTFHKLGATLSFSDLMVGQQVRVTAQGPCDQQASSIVAKSVIVIAAKGKPTPTLSPTPTP